MIKISFDFDSTLDKKYIQEYAKLLINKGYDIWIVTSRNSNEKMDNNSYNEDLFKVADSVGIKKENIIFTCMEDKYKFFKNKDFLIHLDDDWIELNLINKYTKTRGISVFGNINWINKCNKILI